MKKARRGLIPEMTRLAGLENKFFDRRFLAEKTNCDEPENSRTINIETPMKKTLLPVALIVLCGLVGCLPTSINPLYTDKDRLA